MSTLFRELRVAIRSLLRVPGFALVVILTLALGIGANAGIFTLVRGILLEPLPYHEPGRIVALRHAAPGMGLTETGQSDGTFLHYERLNDSFDAMALYNENVVNLAGGDGVERVQVALVTADFFSLLGVTPELGRFFTAEDESAGAPGVVVISHELWSRQYSSDPEIVGRTIELNSQPKTVVGVARRGFDFPRPKTQVWYASAPDPASARFSDMTYSAIARLSPGVTPGRAQADLQRLIPSLAEAYPDVSAETLEESGLRAVVIPLEEVIVGDSRAALWILFGAAGLVLLIACANVGNLLLMRAEYRQREIALRTALGAGWWEIARFFLAESMILALAGGALGLFIADTGVQALVALQPANIPRLHEVAVDAWVAGFTAALAVAAGLVFGGIPLFRNMRPSLAALRNGTGVGTSPAGQRAPNLLVVAQLALALTLLTGAALMAQSFWRLKQVDTGFDARGVLTLEIALPFRPYSDYPTSARLWRDVLEGVRALPGVEAAGSASYLPLSNSMLREYLAERLHVEGAASRSGELSPVVAVQLVTPGYFEAMRIPIIAGEGMSWNTRAETTAPVLVSAGLVRSFLPAGEGVGSRIGRGSPETAVAQQWNTIIGVVGDVRQESIRSDAAATVYVPVVDEQVDPRWHPSHMSLAIRSSVPPLSLAPAVRQIVRELDPRLPIANVRTMEQVVQASTERMTFTMLMLLVAATVALLLGAVGIYGVISYAVSRRTREIGVRIALGARPGDVSRMVLREGTATALAGLGVGVLVALLATRVLRGLLFQVSPTDPLTFAAMAVALLGIAMAATYLPARRAARVHPMEALRAE